MELRVLNYFLAVAREENFTKAAQQLHLTQPTLSRQIADLEQELGVKLFVRSNHHIILTEDGMILKSFHRTSYSGVTASLARRRWALCRASMSMKRNLEGRGYSGNYFKKFITMWKKCWCRKAFYI